jgi:large subunit ribosomal protein L30
VNGLVTDKRQATLRIKWVRSGIGFSSRQKEMVRSLGLRRLSQVVERPDTPQTRGLVAAISHLVEVVKGSAEPVRPLVPEYTILPPEPAAAPVAEAKREAEEVPSVPAQEEVREAAGEAVTAEAGAEAAVVAAPAAKVAKAKKVVKPQAAEKKKAPKKAETKKSKAASEKKPKASKTGKK